MERQAEQEKNKKEIQKQTTDKGKNKDRIVKEGMRSSISQQTQEKKRTNITETGPKK